MNDISSPERSWWSHVRETWASAFIKFPKVTLTVSRTNKETWASGNNMDFMVRYHGESGRPDARRRRVVIQLGWTPDGGIRLLGNGTDRGSELRTEKGWRKGIGECSLELRGATARIHEFSQCVIE